MAEKRDQVVQVRLTTDEKKILKEEAERVHMPLATFLRSQLLAENK